MSDSHQQAPRTHKLARSAIAGVATARVGAAQLRRRLSADQSSQASTEHEARIGRILFAALSQMRGTALKAAQVLSLDAALLPAGVRAELANATHRVTPLNRALVGRVFRAAFGCEAEALFSSFSHPAFAAASLGQVHRATMDDGTQVAVKVQYPGIAATIDSDLALIRAALASIGPSLMPLPDPQIIARVLGEIEQQLHEEVDYLQEADRQRGFSGLARPDDIVIADVIESRTVKTVLTQTLLKGLHLDEWLATCPSEAIRNRQGQAVFDWFMQCAMTHRHIHADLHPGNFLFAGDGRVAVLDFGCTCKLPERFASGFARAWRIWLDDRSATALLLDTYRELGLVASTLDLATFETEVLPAIAPLLTWATEPFTQSFFDFSRKSPMPAPDRHNHARIARHMANFPPQFMSMERAWLGLMHLLGRLGAKVDTRAARGLLAQRES